MRAAVSENLLDVTCVRCLDASLERVAGDGPAKGGSIKPVLTIEDRMLRMRGAWLHRPHGPRTRGDVPGMQISS